MNVIGFQKRQGAARLLAGVGLAVVGGGLLALAWPSCRGSTDRDRADAAELSGRNEALRSASTDAALLLSNTGSAERTGVVAQDPVGSVMAFPEPAATVRADTLERHPILVVSRQAFALEDAWVHVVRPPLANVRESARTGSEGTTSLSIEPGDSITVSAAAHVPLRMHVGQRPWPHPLVLELDPGLVVVTGEVVDDQGSRVPMARLEFESEGRSLHTTSNADGHFELRVPTATPFPIELSAPFVSHPDYFCLDPVWFGFVDDQKRQVTGAGLVKPLRILVLRWAVLHVFARDIGGAGVEGGKLRVGFRDDKTGQVGWPASFSSDSTRLLRKPLVTTLAAAPLPALLLAIEHPDYERQELALPELRPGEETEIDVLLESLAVKNRVRFEVVDREGQAIDGASARLIRERDEEGAQAALQRDSDGIFAFEHPIEPWQWKVLVTARGYLPAKLDMEWLEAQHDMGSQIDPLSVQLAQGGGELVVHVVDTFGIARPGVPINLTAQGASGRESQSGTSDAEGHVTFTGLLTGQRYGVRVGTGSPGGYFAGGLVPDPAAHNDVAPGDSVSFRLVPPASVEGRIGAANAPGSTLTLSCMGSGAKPVFGTSTTIDATGYFRIQGLPPGRYHLWSSARLRGDTGGGSVAAPLMRLDVAAGESQNVGTLTIP